MKNEVVGRKLREKTFLKMLDVNEVNVDVDDDVDLDVPERIEIYFSSPEAFAHI